MSLEYRLKSNCDFSSYFKLKTGGSPIKIKSDPILIIFTIFTNSKVSAENSYATFHLVFNTRVPTSNDIGSEHILKLYLPLCNLQ